MAPAAGGLDVDLQPVPDPEGIDPWLASPGELERSSHVYCYCTKCDVIRRRSCTRCAGTGIVSAWLSVREQRLSVVSVSFDFLARRIHPEVGAIDDFDRSPALYPAALDSDTGWGEVPATLPEALQPPIDPLTDRIEDARIQTFLTAIYFIRYRLRQGRATVEVAGLIPRVLPWSNWNPLKLRVLGLGVCGGLGVTAAVAAALLVPGWDAALHSTPSGIGLLMALITATILTVLLQTRKMWSFARRHLPPRLGGHAHPQRAEHLSAITRTTATTRGNV
jgi:hypothetical protein